MENIDTATFILKLTQSALLFVFGILALYNNKRLAFEMSERFKRFYGPLFHIDKVVEHKIFSNFARFVFIIMGISALIGSVIIMTGPINNW